MNAYGQRAQVKKYASAAGAALAQDGSRTNTSMMSISRKQFNLQCLKFIADCRRSGDDWRLQGEHHGLISDTESVPDESDRLMLTKVMFKKVAELDEILSHEYNVAYSDSFEVPVMYFTISEQDGSPLGYERTISTLIGFAADELNQITHQVEHPILFRPFFMIHPCKTKQFMKSHKELNPDYYLICWLSTVGSILGLRLGSHLADFVATRSTSF